MDQTDHIEHFGMKGMKWGVRRDYVKFAGSKIKFKDEDHKQRLLAALSDHKKAIDEYEKDKGNADKGVDIIRKIRKVEEVSGIPIARNGKLPGETDAQFDKRVDEQYEASIRAVSKAYSDKKKMKTPEGELELRKERVKAEIDDLVELNRFDYKQRKLKFDENEMRKYLEELPWNAKELNKNVGDIKAERLVRGIETTLEVLAISGVLAASAYSIAQTMYNS